MCWREIILQDHIALMSFLLYVLNLTGKRVKTTRSPDRNSPAQDNNNLKAINYSSLSQPQNIGASALSNLASAGSITRAQRNVLYNPKLPYPSWCAWCNLTFPVYKHLDTPTPKCFQHVQLSFRNQPQGSRLLHLRFEEARARAQRTMNP